MSELSCAESAREWAALRWESAIKLRLQSWVGKTHRNREKECSPKMQQPALNLFS